MILVNVYKALKSEVHVNWTAAINVTNFDKWLPKQAVADEIIYRGKPDYVDSNPGGMAIWEQSSLQERGSPLNRVIIKDQFNPRIWPFSHSAFVHYYILLSDERVERYTKQINNIIPSINLEPGQRLLHIEGTFSAQNQVTLCYVMELIDSGRVIGEGDLDEIKQILISRIRKNRFDPHTTYANESAIK